MMFHSLLGDCESSMPGEKIVVFVGIYFVCFLLRHETLNSKQTHKQTNKQTAAETAKIFAQFLHTECNRNYGAGSLPFPNNLHALKATNWFQTNVT